MPRSGVTLLLPYSSLFSCWIKKPIGSLFFLVKLEFTPPFLALPEEKIRWWLYLDVLMVALLSIPAIEFLKFFFSRICLSRPELLTTMESSLGLTDTE